MSWLIAPRLKSVDGVPVGTPYGGGYVGGFISHTANGVPTHALIVAPRAIGATGAFAVDDAYEPPTSLAAKTTNTNTPGMDSARTYFDGYSNTQAMITAGINDHPAAKFCVELSIDGYTDWYLPAGFEYEIVYFNLKPGTTANAASFGSNAYSVPSRTMNYTATYPQPTSVALFGTGGSERFVPGNHVTSTNRSPNSPLGLGFSFNSGNQFGASLTDAYRVRAFRRIAL